MTETITNYPVVGDMVDIQVKSNDYLGYRVSMLETGLDAFISIAHAHRRRNQPPLDKHIIHKAKVLRHHICGVEHHYDLTMLTLT